MIYAGKRLVFKRVERAAKRAKARKKKVTAAELARKYRREVLGKI